MKNNLNLAITSIGDLLLKNRISTVESGSSLELTNLSIPNYQRPYKWTARNVNQLLDDIILAHQENKEIYRVGTLILHERYERNKDDNIVNENNEDKSIYDIVDGQQRCISFALLITAIDAIIAERPELNNEDDTNNSFARIDFLNEQLIDNGVNTYNVKNNYLTLYRRLDSFNNEEIKNIKEFVLQQCELVVVITKDISEAFQFFDSQNARGKKLYPHDLLKAYHLREMNGLSEKVVETTVKIWEDIPQDKLSILFSDYLYRIYQWVKGNRPTELNESNINLFKGISKTDNYPFAQYYKGAYAFAENVNQSFLPFVTGSKTLNTFQLNVPIIAGKPFFDYSKHYYEILKDIQNNDKYYGYYINDNEIVKTLDLKQNNKGVGNSITRLLFDSIILLYVDRFCPETPSKLDLKLLEQFVVIAFVWSYSLRVQYVNLGWQSANNYVLGNPDKHNSINLFKWVAQAENPTTLFSDLSQVISPLSAGDIKDPNFEKNIGKVNAKGIPENYRYFFEKYKYLN